MKAIYRLLILSALAMTVQAQGWAQKMDEARMERDLKVAENILQALLKGDKGKPMLAFSSPVEASYVSDYGVIFSVNANSTMYLSEVRGMVNHEISVVEGQLVTKIQENRHPKEINRDSLREVRNAELIRVVKDFLADYGDMISQLKPSDKLLVTDAPGGRAVSGSMEFGWAVSRTQNSKFAVEVSKQALQEHNGGKITRDQLLKQMKVNANFGAEEKKEADLEILASIIHRIYRSDMSETYYVSNAPTYHRIPDFGVIYQMAVFSSNQTGETFHMPTFKMRDVNRQDRDKWVKEAYPKFEKELKENLVDYGRTLKSLGPDEMLLFRVNLTKCEGCGIPSELELGLKGQVLRDYNSGKLSKEAAMGKMTVKGIGKQ
jgi:hypothetical protein